MQVLLPGAALSLFLLVGGCGMMQPEIADCEDGVKSALRSPSTYKRIKADSMRMTNLDPVQIWVSLEYDAANVYGTPIRDTKTCKYKLNGSGGADLSSADAAEKEFDAGSDKRLAQYLKSRDSVTRDAAAALQSLNEAQAAHSEALNDAATEAAIAGKAAIEDDHTVPAATDEPTNPKHWED